MEQCNTYLSTAGLTTKNMSKSGKVFFPLFSIRWERFKKNVVIIVIWETRSYDVNFLILISGYNQRLSGVELHGHKYTCMS